MMKWAILISSAAVCIGLTASCVLLGGTWSAWQLHTAAFEVPPTIERGSLVLIRKTAAMTIKAGDIAGYRQPGHQQVFIGRVTRVAGVGPTSRYVFSGPTESATQLVFADQVVGRARFSWPYLGRLSNFLHSWPGLLIGLYLPALAVLAVEISRLAQKTGQNSFGQP